MTSLGRSAIESFYLFFISWLLAQTEIQIEGPHGWAENLPTWKLDAPWILRWTNGKPVTGYHVFLISFLLAMFHLPLIFTGFSRTMEGRLLSLYSLMTVSWDFQWFVWNPAWSASRFFREKVWWFPKRVLGLPLEYYAGISASFLAARILGDEGTLPWLRLAVCLLLLNGLSVVAAGWIRRRFKV